MTVRIGTRGSELALWQAKEVARLLSAAGHASELVTIRTTGDKRHDVSLASIGGKGLFIKELEEALERDEIDVAVHSLKDVPSIIPEQFLLAGFLERADPRDAWLQSAGLAIDQLPKGSVIGTSAPRRKAQLLARYPDLVIEDIRGNVDTRVQKMRDGQYAGIVLAAAGLTRLGRAHEITSYFDVDSMLPAAGQGIVAIECLASNETARAAARSINHEPSEQAALNERGVLQKFGTRLDCYSSVAVHWSEGTLRAFVCGVRAQGATVDAVYDSLIAQGAADLLTSPPFSLSPSRGEGRGEGPPLRANRPSPLPSPHRDEPAAGRGKHENRRGKVYLVGAGPGDPRLLTLRAAELIAKADFVALDALVSADIAAMITAEVVYVGKRSSAHTVPQDQINQLLIDEARKGKLVVRLKGGDPFVFGRGGEEAEELAEAGVSFEIVPGISSAIAGPAYAGIPVTHREYATSVTLVTGHEADSHSAGIRWAALAQLDGTIVFMMGFANLPTIVHKLMEHGMSPDRGCAVISHATRFDQRTIAGTLRNIEGCVMGAKLETPALIVVGDVVQLRDTIDWFESKPLFGKRIVVTRAREQASDLKRLLEESGAQVVQFPMISIAPPESFDALDRAIDEHYDWLVFTSTNGVRFFFERLFAKGKDVRALAGRKIAAVGQATAADLRARGIAPDVVPERFLSTELLPLLPQDQHGLRTAVIRAEEGRDELLEELRHRGGEVDLAVAYRNIATATSLDELGQALDVITFTSASTVDNFFSRVSDTRGARLASIGPVTSAAIRKHGREPDIEAKEATIQALHDALL